MVTAVYVLLVGITLLSPALVQTVFGSTVKDHGALAVATAGFLAFCVLVWSIASNPDRYGELASRVVAAIAIYMVLLLWGLVIRDFTARTVLPPLIIFAVLVV